VETFQQTAQAKNKREEIGQLHIVLVEGPTTSKSKKRRTTGRRHSSPKAKVKAKTKEKEKEGEEEEEDEDEEKKEREEEKGEQLRWTGRTDTNKRVVFSDAWILSAAQLDRVASRVVSAVAAATPTSTTTSTTTASTINTTSSITATERGPTMRREEVEGFSSFSSFSSANATALTAILQRHDKEFLMLFGQQQQQQQEEKEEEEDFKVAKGDYIVVRVTQARGHTLRGEAVAKTSIRQAAALGLL
jgi:hypothetical protein